MTEYEETRVKHCTCMSVVIGIRNQLRQHAIFLMLVAPYSIGHTPKIVCVCVCVCETVSSKTGTIFWGYEQL